MNIRTAEGRRHKLRPFSASETRTSQAADRKLILKSMLKWENMDRAGRYLGRGLGKKELVDRVAHDVGLSLSRVLAALKHP